MVKEVFIMREDKKRKRNTKDLGIDISNSQRISMEITMTDQSVIHWVHKILGVGTVLKNLEKVYVKMAQNI